MVQTDWGKLCLSEGNRFFFLAEVPSESADVHCKSHRQWRDNRQLFQALLTIALLLWTSWENKAPWNILGQELLYLLFISLYYLTLYIAYYSLG